MVAHLCASIVSKGKARRAVDLDETVLYCLGAVDRCEQAKFSKPALLCNYLVGN